MDSNFFFNYIIPVFRYAYFSSVQKVACQMKRLFKYTLNNTKMTCVPKECTSSVFKLIKLSVLKVIQTQHFIFAFGANDLFDSSLLEVNQLYLAHLSVSTV